MNYWTDGKIARLFFLIQLKFTWFIGMSIKHKMINILLNLDILGTEIMHILEKNIEFLYYYNSRCY